MRNGERRVWMKRTSAGKSIADGDAHDVFTGAGLQAMRCVCATAMVQSCQTVAFDAGNSSQGAANIKEGQAVLLEIAAGDLGEQHPVTLHQATVASVSQASMSNGPHEHS